MADRRHTLYMRHAITLARRGLGRVSPNPAVGCIIVKDNIIIGRGFTGRGGRPHAETIALAQAGALSKGATAYVTLEPCAHHGETGPCAEALVEAEIAHVVIGSHDPDPRVAGKGVKLLENAGIAVTKECLSSITDTLTQGFFNKVSHNRPLYTLKVATSADGKIAMASGESKWITGPEARAVGHGLRATYDAILVGVGTVVADDPMLDCRIDGMSDRSPARIILDRQLRTPLSAKLVSSAKSIPTYIITESKEALLNEFEVQGVNVITVDDLSDLEGLSAILAGLGLTRVLVEGGGRIHASFLQSGLVDEIKQFIAAKYIGGDGINGVSNLSLGALKDAPCYKIKEIRQVGADLLASFVRQG